MTSYPNSIPSLDLCMLCLMTVSRAEFPIEDSGDARRVHVTK